MQETWVQPMGQEDALEKEWLPTLILLPWESHGQRSREGYSPRGSKDSDTTEWLTIQNRVDAPTISKRTLFASLPLYTRQNQLLQGIKDLATTGKTRDTRCSCFLKRENICGVGVIRQDWTKILIFIPKIMDDFIFQNMDSVSVCYAIRTRQL